MQSWEMQVNGAVQGVGFRPFVYRLAHALGVGGAVWNTSGGVRIRAVAEPRALERFFAALRDDAPAPARVEAVHVLRVEPAAAPEVFRIAASDEAGPRAAVVMPDLATCPACLHELRDPANRRHCYPFTNCTHCGPRFSIITGIPYDRPQTTMRAFTLCPACRAEYDNPLDRRFHAQPNACPVCGPHLALRGPDGLTRASREEALQGAVTALREGRIVAVKGLGGFHLLCDARHSGAVRALRLRKRREEKPFAVMVPDLATARRLAQISDAEAALLECAAAPIVLVDRRDDGGLAPEVAPDNACLGLLLPYTPLHHQLLDELGFPVVATSGNLSDEPLCTDGDEAVARLHGIADLFLDHNRPIARPLDDSIARLIGGKPCLLRRARGFAPLPIPLPRAATEPVLAVGAHLKTTVTLLVEDRAYVGPHIGDLDALEARQAFARAAADLPALYKIAPARWACDRHPDYASTQHAREHGRDVFAVQHHHAHVAACMAEHGLDGPVLGVAWDGTGLGDDGTIWGGEFLVCEGAAFTRVAHLAGFRLPGGDAAARTPAWSAFGALAAHAPDLLPAACARLGLDEATQHNLAALLTGGRRAPFTTSVGRWFDALSALTGYCSASAYEGQAALQLEQAAMRHKGPAEPHAFDLRPENGMLVADLRHTLREVVNGADRPAAEHAARFHQTLAAIVAAIAERHPGLPVILTGGCFQNRLLTEACIRTLRRNGRSVHWHQLVPPNDGGLSLGQALLASLAPPPRP